VLSKAEKINLVKRLLEEGKNYRDIAKTAHISCTQISAIRKELEGESETGEPNIRTRAYEMFKNGDSPLDFAISLKIDKEEAIKLWKEYLELTGHFELLKASNELKGNFAPFLKFYAKSKERRLTLRDIEEGIKRGREVRAKAVYEGVLDYDFNEKEKLNAELDEQIKEKKDTISKLNIEISAQSIVKMLLTQVLDNMRREKERIELFLQIHNSRHNYQRYSNVIPLPYKSIRY